MSRILLLFIFLLVSCSVTRKTKNSGLTVSIDTSSSNQIEINQTDEDLISSKDLSEISVQNILALEIGPGLYRIGNHLRLLRMIEEKKLDISIYSGHGLGAWIATELAFGENLGQIEWKFYKFLRKVKDERFYSKAWWKIVDSVLLNKYKNKNIEDANKTLVFIKKKTKTSSEKITTGKLYPILKGVMDLRHNGISSASIEMFKLAPYESLGANYLIASDVLGENISFKKVEHFYLGLFYHLSGLGTLAKKRENVFFIREDNIRKPLDSLDSRLVSSQANDTQLSEQLDEILKRIKKNKTDHDDSSEEDLKEKN